MMKRSRRRWTASVLAAILVAVQAAFAFASCLSPADGPAQAIARTVASPCHEDDALADGLCVLHCLGERQSLDRPAAKLPVLGVVPVLVVAALPQPLTFRACTSDSPVRASAPPSRIVFSKLLI